MGRYLIASSKEMISLKFLVQGSADFPYEVTFTVKGNNLNAYCTCPAGKNGQYCKHRMSILRGEANAVVSSNRGEVPIVQSWLAGSDIEFAIHDIAEAEHDFDEAKKKLSQAKRALAKAMRQ
jgi:hypothetical protein